MGRRVTNQTPTRKRITAISSENFAIVELFNNGSSWCNEIHDADFLILFQCN